MPIGSAIGGLTIVVAENFVSREMALRMPWFLTAATYLVLFLYAAPRLTTAKLEAARAEGVAVKERAEAAASEEAIAESGVLGAPPPMDEEL